VADEAAGEGVSYDGTVADASGVSAGEVGVAAAPIGVGETTEKSGSLEVGLAPALEEYVALGYGPHFNDEDSAEGASVGRIVMVVVICVVLVLVTSIVLTGSPSASTVTVTFSISVVVTVRLEHVEEGLGVASATGVASCLPATGVIVMLS
jgi:hypothetical protein